LPVEVQNKNRKTVSDQLRGAGTSDKKQKEPVHCQHNCYTNFIEHFDPDSNIYLHYRNRRISQYFVDYEAEHSPGQHDGDNSRHVHRDDNYFSTQPIQILRPVLY
jgi:hypothetical protein